MHVNYRELFSNIRTRINYFQFSGYAFLAMIASVKLMLNYFLHLEDCNFCYTHMHGEMKRWWVICILQIRLYFLGSMAAAPNQTTTSAGVLCNLGHRRQVRPPPPLKATPPHHHQRRWALPLLSPLPSSIHYLPQYCCDFVMTSPIFFNAVMYFCESMIFFQIYKWTRLSNHYVKGWNP